MLQIDFKLRKFSFFQPQKTQTSKPIVYDQNEKVKKWCFLQIFQLLCYGPGNLSYIHVLKKSILKKSNFFGKNYFGGTHDICLKISEKG